ncbi:MAG TPA: TrbI/VirB10 family protein [Candidatus Acidoferrales bacterium]|nr:TrbI/VirB10 family protein [Candidatus Acidoferrales bacterium]
MAEERKTPEQTGHAPEAGEPSETPTIPAQPLPKKPIRTISIAVYGLIGLAALGLISNVTSLHSHFSTPIPKSPYTAKPSTVMPDTVSSFRQQEQEQIRKLEQENAEAQRAAQKAAEAAEAVDNVSAPTMMPCTPGLAGTQGTSSTGSPITCGADGQWHPSAEAHGIPPMTSAQKRALYGREAGDGAREDAAQKAKQRRLEALNSSSVAVDFTKVAAPVAGRQDDAGKSRTVAAREQKGGGKYSPAVKGPAHRKDSTKPKYRWDRYSGKLYRIFEGTVFETVLTNRINGAFAGPIDTMLTTDMWSHDHQQLLIPQGTRFLGTISSVTEMGQERLFVAFHRCIMPDGYSLNLDKFPGLNQIGETGLRDLVNHHYFQIFGASLAIGAVGGVAQIGNGYSGFGYNPSSAIRNGISQEMGQESMQILDRFPKSPSDVYCPGALAGPHIPLRRS